MADIERIFSSVVNGAKTVGDFLARNPQVRYNGKRLLDKAMEKIESGVQKIEDTIDDLKK